MNMMHHNLNQLGADSQVIDTSDAMGEAVVAADKPPYRMSRWLMALLLLVVCFYCVDRLWLRHLASVDSDVTENLSLNKVLVDSVIAHQGVSSTSQHSVEGVAQDVDSSHAEFANVIPENIIKFIDADITVVKTPIAKNNIVIEELKKPLENKIDVAQTLLSAKRLFKRDRLMSPPNHNAYARYEKILSVYPDHPEALDGIQKIVDRYIYLADTVIRKKEHYKVPALIKNAYEVGEKYIDVAVLLDKFSKYLLDESVFLKAEVAKGISRPDDEEEDNARRSMLALTDKKISQAAHNLYAQGDVVTAKHLLEKFVNLTQSWGRSKDLLLKIYLEGNEVALAENFIYEDKTLNTQQFAEKAARVMMTRGDNHTALDMLESYRPAFPNNKDYYMMLAGLYHKTGDFSQAVYWYRQLLAIDHDNARLWLGLAVSLDALNNVDEALQAFDYVKRYAEEESVVKQYINERLLALAP